MTNQTNDAGEKLQSPPHENDEDEVSSWGDVPSFRNGTK